MLKYSDIHQENDNIYYNVNVVYKSEDPKEFRYAEKRSSNLIDSGFDYKVAVVRFSIDTS